MGLLTTLVIPITDAPSSAFSLRNARNLDKLVFVFPSAWTAADLKLQFSLDNGVTWVDAAEPDGTLLKMTDIPTSGGIAQFSPADADGKDYWAALMNALTPASYRVVSIDTSDDTDEDQAAERTIKVYSTYQKAILF